MENKTIHDRMLAIMAEIEPIKKNHENKFQKYKYRSIDDFYSALNPLFVKHGVLLIPTVESVTEATCADRNNNTMFHVTMKVKYTFSSGSGSVEVVSIGEGTDALDKASNKAMTAAFKNAMQQVFIIPTGDPADSEREDLPPPPPKRVEQQPVKQFENKGRITL